MVTNWIMNAFKDANGETSIPMRMAGVVIVSLPLFLVFVFFRKYIMRGVSRSGTKG
jgi:multiple sugar transport system permease protein